MQSYIKTMDWRLPIVFWRMPIYILEAEIVLGVLYGRGGGICAGRKRGLLWVPAIKFEISALRATPISAVMPLLSRAFTSASQV